MRTARATLCDQSCVVMHTFKQVHTATQEFSYNLSKLCGFGLLLVAGNQQQPVFHNSQALMHAHVVVQLVCAMRQCCQLMSSM